MEIKEIVEGLTESYGKDKAFAKELSLLLENAIKLNKHDEIRSLARASEHFSGMHPDHLKFLPAYTRSLKQGDAVRTGISEYAWVKSVMISMNYASSRVNNYMRNFLRLSDAEKARMPEIMEEFSNVDKSLSNIMKLASVKLKKKKNGLKEAKKKEESKEGAAEAPEAEEKAV